MTTADILAFCRAEASAGSSSDAPAEEVVEAPAPEETTAETPAEEAPAAESAPAAPAKKPTSTKDILAAARAAAAAGGEKSAAPPAAEKPKAKAASGAKPTSTKDILAAARAQKAGGAAAAAGSAAPAKKKEAPAKAATTASGDKPSVKEMLAAFRSEKQAAGEKAAPAATTADGKKLPPKMPVPPRKPKAKPVPAPVDENRRSFLAALLVVPSAFAAAWVMLAGSASAWLLALVRFGLPNVLVEPPSKFKIGSPGDYDFGTVSTKWKAERGIWVVHTDRYKGQNVIVALSTVCTHLGCTPNWLEGEQKFKCPCHGSGFYIDGVNFEGPAPRPLERHGIVVAADGMLEVDKGLKFQEEMGQWEDPKSFVSA
ncbi:ubiquinol-cytochrome c reductase iron-sulfur subunit [Symmachiella dynata]|uniref:QcrA and Rieske domain-containing protein n=1 Tax=Symmachiella dynata TaxID=2527995 RepID=UPI0030EFA030